MQSAVPKGQGGMIAVLGTDITNIKEILNNNNKNMSVLLQMIILLDKLWLAEKQTI